MKLSTLISACLLTTGVLALYPPPINRSLSGPLPSSQDDQEISSSVPSDNKHGHKVGFFHLFDNKNDNESNADENENKNRSLNPFYSFYMSTSMIVVSEIGDKSFIIAAIMAMSSPRTIVFSAAITALVIMTLLSGLLGQILPHFISPTLTRAVASILFLIFGINLLREGINTDRNQGVEEEVAEVEEELASARIDELMSDLEKGDNENDPKNWKTKLKFFFSYLTSPIWYQIFSMTFLAEWGDRSQITTIAMAAGGDWIMVILGACIGHSACTLLAVLTGHAISTRISMKTILLGGAVSFLIFSILYGYSAVYQ